MVKVDSKKLKIISVVIAVLILCFVGYSFANKSNNSTKQASKTEEPADIKVNEDKTAELKEEKILTNGKVYVQDNKVVATMIVKDDVSDADAKALANKYAKELKEEYKNMPVNVMAVKNDKNIANVKIE
ncbi:hypothetical protein [Clostridium sp. cel8]|uniref:hypothetical protein n=1 Tax=Clostridium sp. cel8 TaxID=2663123 RepID=UPI001A9B8EF6|nr:hypothetical protein [Clostridium sp. cel8]